MKLQLKNLMLYVILKKATILTRLTPVATLVDTKQQSATTSISTQIVTFS